MVKYFPQYFHLQTQVFCFEEDSAVLFFVVLVLSFYVSLWFFLLSVPLYFFDQWKQKKARGFVNHCFYYLGFEVFRGYPSYLETNYEE